MHALYKGIIHAFGYAWRFNFPDYFLDHILLTEIYNKKQKKKSAFRAF